MAYDEGLAKRVREALAGHPSLVEKKMFGGVGFMLRGNMCCGVLGDELIVRVGPHAHDETMGRPNTRKFDFTGKPMRGLVVVTPKGLSSEEALREWVARGAAFALTLPAK